MSGMAKRRNNSFTVMSFLVDTGFLSIQEQCSIVTLYIGLVPESGVKDHEPVSLFVESESRSFSSTFVGIICV